MTEARIGWGGEVHVGTTNLEASLVELAEVNECTFPSDEVDEVEATHLKSPNRRKEFIAGLRDGGECTATFNYSPGSATDLLLTDALETGTTRAIRFVIPDDSGTGAADWNILTHGFVKKYAVDTMSPGAKLTSTATFRITGAQEQGAGAAGS